MKAAVASSPEVQQKRAHKSLRFVLHVSFFRLASFASLAAQNFIENAFLERQWDS
jgi:hypothetical protein